jgi:hypothetical protein
MIKRNSNKRRACSPVYASTRIFKSCIASRAIADVSFGLPSDALIAPLVAFY